VLVPHASGLPLHEGVLDHEQFPARQVALVALAEQAGGVPEQPPPLVDQRHPLVRHWVRLTLLEQVADVPMQVDEVGSVQVQPG
jgi:hypothetical protein